MRFFSFVRDGVFLSPVEIQVSILPGLPDIKFSGLVDTGIKESITRIKSSFRSMGYKWPNKQIFINLSPANTKKSSLGMDLALSSAILYQSGQINFHSYPCSSIYMYGELDLNGNITAPKDWAYLPLENSDLLITGAFKGHNYRENNYLAKTLNDLDEASKMPVEDWRSELKRPKIPDILFSKQASELLQVVAAGEHNILLCGEAGSGKTTLAESLFYILQTPNRKNWEEFKQINQKEKIQDWRPFINPHHSTTSLSMIGGGSPLFLGEISKAHGGLLVLDEYLEFHPKVQEALREPVQKGYIRLVRRGQTETFPANFLMAATSNLCPCGDYIPGKPVNCSYSVRRCQSHLQRLSGPMLDRFDILSFSNQWKGDKTVNLKQIYEKVVEATKFRTQTRKQKVLNKDLSLEALKSMLDKKTLDNLPESTSQRRTQSLLKVARTFSDLEKKEHITHSALQKAMVSTIKNFYFLKNGMLMN